MPLPKGFQWTDSAINMQQNGYVAPSFEEIEADKEEYKASDQLFSEWDWQNQEGLGPQGEQLPEFAIGWKPNGEADFGTGFQGWWKKAYSNVRSAWKTGYEEGLQISGLTEFAIKKAQGEEEGQATIEQMQEERKPETQNAAYWTAAAEATKEVFNQALWGVLDGLSQPAIWTEQALGSAGLAIDQTIAGTKFEDIDWKRNWDASRLAYSGMFDATITEEMYRRIDAGIRPDLAAQEVMIQNPNTLWPELIGQILLDPLNVVTIFGKAGQQAKLIKNVKKTFHQVDNPVVAKLLDDIDEIAKMDENKAYNTINELVRNQQGLTAAAEHADDIQTAAGKLDELSKSYKLGSLTRDGKVAHIANQTGEVLMHVVNNSSPDEALEIIRGMVKSVSKNPEEAAEGVAAMLHFPDAKALFSEAGNNTTVMLSRMVEKFGDTWLKNIDELKGNPAELTKNLLSKLDEVGEEMFPSVSSMLKAEDEIRKGVQFANDAAKLKATKLAERAKELPSYVKAATRFHDAAQTVVGPINRFFIGAYMGWSPGYAFRNFSNNSLQLLIDYGPGVLLGKADDMFSKASKLHGGALWGVSEDAMEASLFKQPGSAVSSYTGSQKATDVKAIVGAVKEKGLKGPVLGMSHRLEANAAKRIIAKTYTKTFDQGVKAMTKALAPDLRAAGFSDAIINKLPTYIMQHDGDAAAVINALRDDVTSGVIDLFNDIDRIDPKYKSFLSDVGKWDEYAETVLRAPTREAATAAAQKIFDDIAQAGDFVYREGRPVVDNADKFLKMAERGGLSEQRGQLISLRKTESRKAIQAAESILAEADDLGAQLGLPVGTLKQARNITGLNTWGNDAAKEADRLAELAWKLTEKSRKGGANLNELWMAYPELFPNPPAGILDPKSFRDALWSAYDQVVSRTWGQARDTAIDNVTGYLDDLKKAGAQIPDAWRETIKTAQEGAQQYDNAMVGRFGELVEETPMPYGSRTTQISQIASKYGIQTATEAGIPTDKRTLALINKYADVKYSSLEDVPLEVAEDAFKAKAGKATEAVEQVAEDGRRVQEATSSASEGVRDPDLPYFDEAGNLVEPSRKRILPPPSEAEAPPISRAIHEQMEDVTKMRAWVMDDITKNFGKKQVVDKVKESALQKAEIEVTQKIAENRLIASRVAQANRDFTLLNYGEKSYWDVTLAYLYPFHFWYKGTYKNWMKRVVTNPSVLAHYAHYKENLGIVHAGMPDWYKHNINTNDLPGIDVENPLYFNLEATLWPLNGLTNTDFNDPSKRVNWWTHTLDFANKFGPSTWSPINMITGLALYQQGEKEAGERWMGRLIPQSATIKAGASLLGVTNLETDPFVSFLQGGLDPYERRRVGRALAEMEQLALSGELPYSQEQIQDAAYAQEGPIWEEAMRRAVRGRAPSQISSYLFGVGFKGRTAQDVEIDRFYSDYHRMWAMRPNLTEEEFREGMDAMYEKYPFADTVLLSRRSGVERDAGLAYNVLKRIPPGKTNEIAEAAGIDPALLNKFFETKGQIDQWDKADYNKFMSGVLNIGAVLEIPADMTRREWTAAKNAYKGLSDDAKQRFGDDILDEMDAYYAAKTKSYDVANAYLDSHPELEEYMNWRAERIVNSPLLAAYYGGASMIEGYYRSQQYAEIEKELGADIFDIVDQYNDLRTFGDEAESKRFYNQNKAKIRKYYDIKDRWSIYTNQQVAQLSNYLPEGIDAGIREDIDVTSPGAQQLAGALQDEGQMSFEELQSYIPPRLMNLTQDYFLNGDQLPESARRQLERLANELGFYDTDELLQTIGQGLYSGQP